MNTPQERRQQLEIRDRLPEDATELFAQFGRAIYMHLRQHEIHITYPPMLEGYKCAEISQELAPILAALRGEDDIAA